MKEYSEALLIKDALRRIETYTNEDHYVMNQSKRIKKWLEDLISAQEKEIREEYFNAKLTFPSMGQGINNGSNSKGFERK